MELLVFQLYGPLASWGEIAVGESRHSAPYPSKSALIGLLAAALGIRRDEDDLQQAMATGYRFAVKVLGNGSLLKDYHTTQVPDSVRKFRYRTRRDELVIGRERLGTILSSREYRCDAFALVSVCATDTSRWTLNELFEALLTPKFHLYLGRKSCPLALPLKPVLDSYHGFCHALDAYTHTESFSNRERYVLSLDKAPARYYWEGDAGDIEPQQTLIRHDQPLSRSRWQFVQRSENLFIKGEDS